MFPVCDICLHFIYPTIYLSSRFLNFTSVCPQRSPKQNVNLVPPVPSGVTIPYVLVSGRYSRTRSYCGSLFSGVRLPGRSGSWDSTATYPHKLLVVPTVVLTLSDSLPTPSLPGDGHTGTRGPLGRKGKIQTEISSVRTIARCLNQPRRASPTLRLLCHSSLPRPEGARSGRDLGVPSHHPPLSRRKGTV